MINTQVYLILLILLVINFNCNAITVLESIPAPNYDLTRNDDDLLELTDGKFNIYPIWTRKSSVGWKFNSIIQLKLKMSETDLHNCKSGSLNFTTARGTKAGVKMPRRIDVYSNNRYTTGIMLNDEQYTDAHIHRISVQIHNIDEYIDVIVHAGGSYIMLDEISWMPDSVCAKDKPKTNSTSKYVSNLKQDSIDRLKHELMSIAYSNISRNKKLNIWFADPWDTLPSEPNIDLQNNITKHINQFGKKTIFVVGLSGACKENSFLHIKIRKESINKNIKLYKIKDLLSFDGKIVYDPLIPIINGAMPCTPNIPNYIWFDVNNDAKTNEQIIIADISDSDGNSATATVNLTQFYQEVKNCELNAVNWAYRTDTPIWASTADKYDDLIKHGINVFVIHPAYLSLPFTSSNTAKQKRKELLTQLQTIWSKSPNAKVIFFMAFERWKDENKKYELNKLREKITIWVNDFYAFMGNNNFKEKTWALYPIDEPKGSKVDDLIWVSEIIKSANPDIKIYANPIANSLYLIDLADLSKLRNHIDIFQPSVKLASKHDGLFNQKNWSYWIYENPVAPAKSATPYFYRSLAVKAWVLGAGGTGFWSYSDTDKSSAWDDYDGKRPDWAVVYDAKSEIISSRRWEAFSHGIEEYKLLCTYEASISQSEADRIKNDLIPSINDPKTFVRKYESYIEESLITNKNELW